MLCWGLSSWQCQHVSSHVDRTYFSWWHPQYVLFVGSCRLHDPYVSHLPISHWWTTNEILLMYYVYSLTSSTLLWIRKLRGLRFQFMKLSCPQELAVPKCFSSYFRQDVFMQYIRFISELEFKAKNWLKEMEKQTWKTLLQGFDCLCKCLAHRYDIFLCPWDVEIDKR